MIYIWWYIYIIIHRMILSKYRDGFQPFIYFYNWYITTPSGCESLPTAWMLYGSHPIKGCGSHPIKGCEYGSSSLRSASPSRCGTRRTARTRRKAVASYSPYSWDFQWFVFNGLSQLMTNDKKFTMIQLIFYQFWLGICVSCFIFRRA